MGTGRDAVIFGVVGTVVLDLAGFTGFQSLCSVKCAGEEVFLRRWLCLKVSEYSGLLFRDLVGERI